MLHPPLTVTIAVVGSGIGVGFQRWNSWDLLNQPRLVAHGTIDWARSPYADIRPTGVALAVTAFFGLAYLTIWALSFPAPRSASPQSLHVGHRWRPRLVGSDTDVLVDAANTMSPDNRPGAPNATRGIVIVVIAGLIGVFLLSRGGTTPVLAKDKATPTHATTTVPSVPSIAPETSTTAPATTTPPAQVSVAIFNATGGAVVGAAGNNKAKLTPLGYTQVSIFDTTPTDASAVYYAEGSQGDAQAIAQVLGISDVAAASSATTIPSQGQGMAVVVVIGKDAGSTTN